MSLVCTNNVLYSYFSSWFKIRFSISLFSSHVSGFIHSERIPQSYLNLQPCHFWILRQLFYRMCNISFQLDSGYEFGGQEYHASDKVFLSVYHGWRQLVLIFPFSNDANFDHLDKVVSTSFLHCNVIIVPLCDLSQASFETYLKRTWKLW